MPDYDPRMLQMAQMGVRMMAPPPQPMFDNPANQPQAQRPRQWWENLPPMPGQAGQSANRPDDTGQSANRPKGPPSLYDMMLNLGRMSRPQYDKAMQGPGSYGVAPQNAAALGPWAWLGSMGGGGTR